MKNIYLTLFITFLFLVAVTASAQAFQGKVVGVAAGDTITVMNNGRGEKIRLYGVDCPEKAQDFGQRAKQFTSGMVFGKVVEVEPVVKDRYGRTVGIVKLDGKCLNEALIRSGHAWLYKRYCKKPFCSQWLKLEGAARANKIGLWSHPNPIPPWDFRRPRRKAATSRNFNGINTAHGLLHGNTSSKIFHGRSCSAYNCKNCVMVFKTRNEAIAAGYRPCRRCQP